MENAEVRQAGKVDGFEVDASERTKGVSVRNAGHACVVFVVVA